MFGSGDLKYIGVAMWCAIGLAVLGLWKLVELVMWIVSHVKIQ
jgi:hypothetical protein